MLAKLIKHEYRATARLFLPLFGAVLVLSGLSWGMMRLGGVDAARRGNTVFSALTGILTLLAILSVFVLMVCAVLITIQRFYKNLLGDEGYLMLTLPATPAQHIAAKLTVGLVWTAAALAITLLVVALLGLSIAAEAFRAAGGASVTVSQVASDFAASFAAEFGMPLWRGGLLLGLFFLCGVTNIYLMTYLSMAVGSQWLQQRLGASIGAYVVLDVVRRIVFILATAAASLLFSNPNSPLGAFFAGLNMSASITLVLCAGGAELLAEGALYFFLTRRLLTRRLNLA